MESFSRPSSCHFKINNSKKKIYSLAVLTFLSLFTNTIALQAMENKKFYNADEDPH